MSNQVELAGRVVTGLGVAAPATSLDWFRAAMQRLWGFEPVPGTLNVIADGEGDRREADRLFLTASTVLVPPTPDLCCALLIPARIGRGDRSLPAFMFRPMVHGYNPAQLEFLAPVNLREALGLQDGDEITISAVDAKPAHKWVAPEGSDTGGQASSNMPGVQTGQARLVVDLSIGPLECQVLWAITQQGITVSLFGGIPHVGSTALAIPRPSLKDPSRTSATSSVLNVTGHKDDELARRLAESLAAGLNRVVAVTAGVHAGPEGVYDLPVEDLKRIIGIVGRVDEIIRMAAGQGKV